MNWIQCTQCGFGGDLREPDREYEHLEGGMACPHCLTGILKTEKHEREQTNER